MRRTGLLIVMGAALVAIAGACERRDGDGDTTVRIQTGTDTVRDTIRDTIRDTVRDTTR
jgi:hypothetical protein